MDGAIRMLIHDIKDALRFYFITDDCAPALSPVDQAKIAVSAGASVIQYRNKHFSPRFYDEVIEIRNTCKSNDVLFLINDDILLARAVSADGVHVGQEDESPAIARKILGADAVVGVSVSTPEELRKTDLTLCDYIGAGPVFHTGTKADAKSVIGLSGLKQIADAVCLPVVAIGGINAANAAACFAYGACGVSLISALSRSQDPEKSARELGKICTCAPRNALDAPWKDEFGLIDKLIASSALSSSDNSWLIVPPGDDASLLKPVSRPVITTDAHREGVHFSFHWQTPEEVGQKAVVSTLSDLAAAYAGPISLFINLGLPAYVSDQTVESLYRGIISTLKNYGCELGGGNISSAERLCLDLFALGQGRDDIFPLRSAAKAGDGLYCTGPLGLARAGLAALMKREYCHQRLIEKFKFPRARFDAAKILADQRVVCAMDISDGLAGDAAHIARASGISIRLEIDSAYIDPELKNFCRQFNCSDNDMAIAGGEDYELLFACPPEAFEHIRKFLPEAYPVGKCLRFNGKHLINPPQSVLSFRHGEKQTHTF
jgi:thiamine-monophosphate kinase